MTAQIFGEQPHQPELGQYVAARPRQRGRRALIAAVVVLLLGLVVATVLIVNNARSAEAWRAVAEDRQTALSNLTAQHEAAVADLEDANAGLAAMTGKYNDATARIRALADEKAQVGDQAAWLKEVASLSQLVTTELDGCVDNLQTLQFYLLDYESYDLTALGDYAQEVNDRCNQAQTDNAALAALLEQ